MAKHDQLTSWQSVHQFAYSSNADPALDGSITVTPYKGWVNTGSSNTLKVRNAANTAWEDVSVAGAATTPAFGSNSNSVAVGNVGGASTLASRADHVHLGVRSLAHTSNTFSGPVILTASGGLGITSPSSGTFNFFAPTASAGGAGATNLDGLSDVAKATSMPGSPATNDLVFRTDLGLFFYYDGTRWLSTTLFREPLFPTDALNPQANAGAALRGLLGWAGTYDLYMTTAYFWTYVGVPNTGTQYWTLSLTRVPSGTALGNFTTAADTQSVFTSHTITINALAGTSDVELELVSSKTSTPAAIYITGQVAYRLVG